MAESQSSCRLEPGRLDPAVELAAVVAASQGDGAIVSFVGIARPQGHDGKEVLGLYLDHYPDLTERSMREIVAAANERFPDCSLTAVHRCGEVLPGDAIVFVAATSRHRRLAFEAADYVMDRLKTEAVFWKKERRADGSVWIEPTEQDHRDRERWSQNAGR